MLRPLSCSFALITTSITLSLISPLSASASDFGPVTMGSFYTALPAIPDNAKIGTLVKVEKIPTSMPGAQAWKMAYVSSDAQGKKTLVTGIVAAPDGAAPAGGRPVMALLNYWIPRNHLINIFCQPVIHGLTLAYPPCKLLSKRVM